jgi:hypothetical protein
MVPEDRRRSNCNEFCVKFIGSIPLTVVNSQVPSARGALRHIASLKGARVVPCTEYDPNVVRFGIDPESPTCPRVLAGAPFKELSKFKYGGRKMLLRANDSVLSVTLELANTWDPFSVLQSNKVFAMTRVEDGATGRGFSLFTSTGKLSTDQEAVIKNRAFDELVHQFRSEESLHFSKNQLTAYLSNFEEGRVESILRLLMLLAEVAHKRQPEQIDLRRLPDALKSLEQYIRRFAAIDEDQRRELIMEMPTEELMAIRREVSPHLRTINSFLNEADQADTTDTVAALTSLAEFIDEMDRQM